MRKMEEGFRFRCQPGCTECCRQRGFVYLNEGDLKRAAEFLGLTPAAFEGRYAYRTRNHLRLRVPPNAHCPFLLEDRCSIHPAKPDQCRVFPFWPELVASRQAWNKTAGYCPGIGKGQLISIRTARARSLEMDGGR